MKKVFLLITLLTAFKSFAEVQIETEQVGTCKVVSSTQSFTKKGDTLKFFAYKVDGTYYDPMFIFNLYDQSGNQIKTDGQKVRTNLIMIDGKVSDDESVFKIKERRSWFKGELKINKENKTAAFGHKHSRVCDWGHCDTYVDAWDLALENCEIDTTFLKDVHFEK